MSEHAPSVRAHPDAIRIVPLNVSPDVLAVVNAPPASPHLTYRNGPLLTSAQVITVFWGLAWQQQPLAQDATRLKQFFDAILVSPLIDALAEYSVPGQSIGHGARTASATLTSTDPGSSVTDAAIQSFLQQETVAGGSLPAPTSQTLYIVFLPPGTAVSMGGGRSCLAFCGYHDTVNGEIFYAVLPYPNCSGCLGGMAAFDAQTVTASHELCEAITDPVPGTGWYDDTNGEIGDICAWQTTTVAGYTVQKEWSNSKNSCA